MRARNERRRLSAPPPARRDIYGRHDHRNWSGFFVSLMCDQRKAKLLRRYDGLAPIVDLKLVPQDRHVILQCLFTDFERCCDFLAGSSDHKQVRNLAFAAFEYQVFGSLPPQRRILEAGDHVTRKHLCDVSLSRVGRGDRTYKFP